jgi:hypothetical protein
LPGTNALAYFGHIVDDEEEKGFKTLTKGGKLRFKEGNSVTVAGSLR